MVGVPAAELGPGVGMALAASPPPAPGVPDQRLWARRARDAYQALQRHFYAADGTGLYHETFPPQQQPAHSYLWPYSRVLAGTMALAGIPSHLIDRRRYRVAVRARLAALARYYDPAAHPAGYDSGALPPAGQGGDKYYDDAAWIGLALAQHHQMTGAVRSLHAARHVLQFVYPRGWNENPNTTHPGGIFWVQQRVGLGVTNHDRTATSNAPNAELAYHLAHLYPRHRAAFERAGNRMHTWVSRALYNLDGSGLVYDHVRTDGTIDPTLYTYNQGALVAADVARYRLTRDAAWLVRARALAGAALAHFSPTYYIEHSPAFNAIYFRGLLQLQAVSPLDTLRAAIQSTMHAYADAVWRHHRSPEGLYRFADSPGTGYNLLDQGAVLQLFATLAWNTTDYPKLA